MTMRPIILALVGMLAAGAASAAEGPRGNATSGKQLFDSKGCYSCHGYMGQGSREGPRLVPATGLAPFVAQLRTPRAIMPPFTEVLVSDQQAADIYAYLENLPKPPDPKTIRILQ